MSQPLENLLPGYVRLFQGPNGSFVDMHETHGKMESRQNLPIALFLAAHGEQVRLLPVLREPGVKYPDATRNGVEWEFKIPEGHTTNAIDKALRDGCRQASRILIQLPVDFDRKLLEQGLYNRVQRTATIVEVAILLVDTLYLFSRQDIVSNAYRGRIS